MTTELQRQADAVTAQFKLTQTYSDLLPLALFSPT